MLIEQKKKAGQHGETITKEETKKIGSSFNKYLVNIFKLRLLFVSVLIFEFIFIAYFFADATLVQVIIVLLFIAPSAFFVDPKSLFRNTSTVFMSIFIFFTVPLSISFFISSFLKLKLYTMFGMCFFICLVAYYILLRIHKLDEFLMDRVRVSLDLIRMFFLVVLAITSIYARSAKSSDAFNAYTQIFSNMQGLEINKLKDRFQNIFQAMSLPFVAAASLLRGVTDYIISVKKHMKTSETAKKSSYYINLFFGIK
jgi:hypothetical protein